MPRLQAKSFAAPDEIRSMPLVRVETVVLDDVHVGHCRFEPGWRWSTAFGPMLGAGSCPIRHLGYSISGVIRVAMDDGQMLDIGSNTAFDIPAGHDKWVIGTEPWVTIEWGGSGRAMGEALNEAPGRLMATIVFTDIVDSTGRVRAAGDAAWGDLLSVHNGRMREQLNIFRGREVKTTGDGMLAVFDSPTRGVRCAWAMTGVSRDMGIAIRAGAHTGELESVGDDVRGIAVHVASRVMSLAEPGSVLITATTADLIEGSGIQPTDAGSHELKGIPGARPLMRVIGTG